MLKQETRKKIFQIKPRIKQKGFANNVAKYWVENL